ncbi:hypothetical protein NMY22_g4784 [Coprinellus aureogranulatus]|nr:hypothetical protein NMY22_g4784 [Coprinellus aureogranulatus]
MVRASLPWLPLGKYKNTDAVNELMVGDGREPDMPLLDRKDSRGGARRICLGRRLQILDYAKPQKQRIQEANAPTKPGDQGAIWDLRLADESLVIRSSPMASIVPYLHQALVDNVDAPSEPTVRSGGDMAFRIIVNLGTR